MLKRIADSNLHQTRKRSMVDAVGDFGLFEEDAYSQSNVDFAPGNCDQLIHHLTNSFEARYHRLPTTAEIVRYAITEYGLFNTHQYLQNNPDVAEAKVDPVMHYLMHGFKEGRKAHSAPFMEPGCQVSVSVDVTVPNEECVQTGLTQISFGLKSNASLVGQTVNLVMQFPNTEFGPWTKAITLVEGRQEFWLAINTHLLSNGENTILMELQSFNKQFVWSKTKKIIVENCGAIAEKVRNSLRRHGSPLVIDGVCDSSLYDYSDPSLSPWFDQPDALEHIDVLSQRGDINDRERHWLTQFVNDGFVIIENMVETSLLEQISSELDEVVARKVKGYEYGTSQRIEHLHHMYSGIRKLWKHDQIMHLLELIFESTPRPCQTLTYIFGSQQDAHQDTVHLTPFPAGYMCGVWVAIDDVKPNSGELEVYRGSHRLPRVYLKDTGCVKVSNGNWSEFIEKVVMPYKTMLASGDFERVVYRPKRGTVLIWHENLMHGGTIRIDKSLSRRSIVCHVFADGALVFYDSTGLVGHMEPRETILNGASPIS